MSIRLWKPILVIAFVLFERTSLGADGAQEAVFILQGEKGETGDPGPPGPPGDKGVQGDPGVGWACSGGVCQVPDGADLLVNGTISASHGSFDSVYFNRDCPMGYQRDETETGFILCKREVDSGRFDEMVKVGSFWIDKYETSVWDGSDCAGQQIGAVLNDWSVQGNGSDFALNDVYGCSLYDVVPTRFVTWFQAAQSCLASGKRLCRNAEWQMASLGTPDNETEVPANPVCNIWSGLLPASAIVWGVEGMITRTGNAAQCISNIGANDMIGNLAEWVEEWGIGGKDWQEDDVSGTAPWPGSAYNVDGTWGIDGRAFNGNEFINGLPAAVVRGGDWEDGIAAGAYAISFFNAPSTSEWRMGTRCCLSY